MEQFLKMPFDITAVKFDSGGRSIPKRLDCAGRSFRLQSTTCGRKFGFSYQGRYYWIERRGNSWCWANHSTI